MAMLNDYDSLSPEEQKLRRQEWDKEIKESISKLDLASEFKKQGLSWVEADESGNVIYRN